MVDWAKIRGIVFDLDGVLTDSSACHRAAFEQVFESFGIRDFEYSAYAGWRTPEVIAHVLGKPANSVAVMEAAQAKSRLARALIAERQPLAPGCVRLLCVLAKRYKLGLASSGSRASVEAFLNLSGCRGVFQSVLSGDDVAQAKPHPEIYLRTLENLGIEPG